ncbi:MAG: DUF2069 domain-containing protein [Wenzhouxiangellaceae bacterium]
MTREALRWLWVALIALQIVWFGVIAPIDALGPIGSAAVFAVPLLLPAWSIWRLNLRGIVIGGMFLLFYFCVAVAEVWAQPVSRIPALIQVGLILWYFTALYEIRRRERRNQ